MRKTFTTDFKATVALAALSSDKTIAQISSEFAVHETQINEWKRQAKDGIGTLFSGKVDAGLREKDVLIERLYALVGQRDAELAWLKKRTGIPSSP